MDVPLGTLWQLTVTERTERLALAIDTAEQEILTIRMDSGNQVFFARHNDLTPSFSASAFGILNATLNRLKLLATLLCPLYPVYIVNEVPSDKDVEDRCTPNSVELSQVQVITDVFQDFCFSQNMPVMSAVSQAVDICLDFHCPNLISHKIGKVPVSLRIAWIPGLSGFNWPPTDPGSAHQRLQSP